MSSKLGFFLNIYLSKENTKIKYLLHYFLNKKIIFDLIIKILLIIMTKK